MDINNIKFLGYCYPAVLRKTAKQRENPMSLKSFCSAVNQDTTNGCCSCCKQAVKVYAVMPWGLPIKPDTLSLCLDCVRKLPNMLDVHNLYSNGAPPLNRITLMLLIIWQFHTLSKKA